MDNKGRFVDELLDSALAHQREAEPRAGLDARILEHVRAVASEQSTRGKAWKWWVAAAATAAVVVMFVVIRVAHRPQTPAVQTSQAGKAVTAPPAKQTLTANSGETPKTGAATAVVEPKRVVRRENKPSRQVEAHRWPSQFPTPAPLTEEQKALVQYVRETPPEELAEPILKTELTVQHVEIKPLVIPPLEIKPLALGPVGKESQ
jgi:hypothetical protein